MQISRSMQLFSAQNSNIWTFEVAIRWHSNPFISKS